ncbi:unnamed protein product [Closterium sp. NIES-54]
MGVLSLGVLSLGVLHLGVLRRLQLHEWYVGRQGRAPGARGPAAGGAGAGVSATGVVSAGGSGAAAGVGAGGSGAAEGAGAGGSGAAAGAGAGGSGAAAGAGAEGSESAVVRSPWSSRLRPRVPLTSQQLHDWYGRRQGRASQARGSTAGGNSAGDTGAGSGAGLGGARTGGTGAAGAGGAEPGGALAGDPGSGGATTGDTETRDPRTGGAGSGGAAAGGAGPGRAGAEGSGAAGGAGAAEGAGAAGSGGAAQPRLFFAPPSPSSQPPSDSVPRQTGALTERREPASRPVSPVHSGRPGRRVPCSRQPAVTGTHIVVRRPSSPPQRVPLPSPPASSLPTFPKPESDRTRAPHSTITRLLATVVTDPSFESAAASALVAELVDFAAACRLDYAASLVAESDSNSPPSVGGECALGMDVLEDRQEDFECLAAAVPRFAFMLLAPEGDPDALDIPTPRSYAEAITGTQWSLRRPVYGLRQAPHEWHDTLRTKLAALGFAPSTADPSLFLRTDTSLPPFYVLVYVDDLFFATADTEALTLLKSELEKRHTCTDLGELRSYLGLQITRDRARRTITLTQSHMVHQVLQRLGFQFSSPQPTPLSTSHSLSAPPSDEFVEPSGPYPEILGCLMYLMTCTRPDLAYPLSLLARYVAPGRHRRVHWDAAKRVLRYLCSTSGMGLVLGGRGPVVLTGHADASWVDDSATQRSSQGYTFSLGSGFVSWRSTRSSSVLSSSCEAEIYTGAMAAQELCWLTYLLTDLGEQPRSPPVLYVDNKAMIALCQEHRLEHRTKHIALRYFLARELQQRGQLRLAYVATRANTADVFTKALPPDQVRIRCGGNFTFSQEMLATTLDRTDILLGPIARPQDRVRTGGTADSTAIDPTELNELRKQLDYMLEKEFIRPILSPFAAPILFTPKKDGGFRMCINCCSLNRVAIKSRYPIPRADKLIDQLCITRVFSKIDLRGGYHQIRVNPPDCPKTAFRTRYRSFEYTVMPFGLTNAPATFQMTMNEAFRPLSDKCVIVYLDDILIYSPDRAQHLQDIEAAFKILSENRLLMKASMCEFLQDSLEFLGHIISSKGVEICQKKIATIQAWHAPTNLTELRSFLGFVNYVHRFVPDMAKLTTPLTDLLRKGVEYTWGEKEQAAFSALKQILCSPPVLHIADPHRLFELVTDAAPAAC